MSPRNRTPMTPQQLKRNSKFLSLVLRHKPEIIGIELDEEGWTSVDVLLSKLESRGRGLTRAELDEVVRNNDKQRYAFDESGERIRATQGHSVSVSLSYEYVEPPEQLYHGTPEMFVASIRREGLTKQQRHHVHLHEDRKVAQTVGGRRGKPVLLIIESQKMYEAGFQFQVTPNQVWLTDSVPPEFLVFPEES